MFVRSRDFVSMRLFGFVSVSFLVGSMAFNAPAEPITSALITTMPATDTSDRIRMLYRVRRLTSVHAEPRFDVEPHGFLSPGQQILITAKTKDAQWFRVATRDGLEGFAIGSLIRPDEEAKPIDLALWPKPADGSVSLEPVPAFGMADINLAALTVGDKRKIQKALIYLGLYDGAIDGRFGERTFTAIQEFQQSRSENGSDQLTSFQYRSLMQLANNRLARYSMRTFSNANLRYRFDFPSDLLPLAEQVGPDTWRLSGETGQAEMLIIAGPKNTDLQSLHERLDVPGKTSYSLLEERLLIVAGDDDGTRFYHIAKGDRDHLVQLRLSYAAEFRLWDHFAPVLFNSFDIDVD